MPTRGKQTGYLHGFSSEEQNRLYDQAKFLEHKVYENIDIGNNRPLKLIEIGSGVGAQTAILRQRFPQAKIHCVDAAATQVERAKNHLAMDIAAGMVEIHQGDATKLQFDTSSFDCAFICWLLEHVNSPLEVLQEAARVLKTGGLIYCTEVLNSSLYLNPYSPATLQYWFAFNDHQWNLGGDPFVGAKLGHYLNSAGFQDIKTWELVFHYDSRSPKMRLAMIQYWTKLLLSGAPALVEAGRVAEAQVEEMRKELQALTIDREAVFYYSAMQAVARVY